MSIRNQIPMVNTSANIDCSKSTTVCNTELASYTHFLSAVYSEITPSNSLLQQLAYSLSDGIWQRRTVLVVDWRLLTTLLQYMLSVMYQLHTLQALDFLVTRWR